MVTLDRFSSFDLPPDVQLSFAPSIDRIVQTLIVSDAEDPLNILRESGVLSLAAAEDLIE